MTGAVAAASALGAVRGSLADVPALIIDNVVSPDNALAYLQFKNDGDLIQQTSGGDLDLGGWLISGNPASFDINVTVDAGALQVGAAGTFNLGTTHTFGCDRATVGSNAADVTLKLRRAGLLTDLATVSVSFGASQS